jgi:hypothetical protein
MGRDDDPRDAAERHQALEPQIEHADPLRQHLAERAQHQYAAG